MIEKKNAQGNFVRVIFELPSDTAHEQIAVVGDFNDWDPEKHPMKRLKKGTWRREVYLQSGRSYEFRYFIDGHRWRNDETADRYVPNAYGGENSVVEVR